MKETQTSGRRLSPRGRAAKPRQKTPFRPAVESLEERAVPSTCHPAVYDPSSGFFFLKNTTANGGADVTFQYGVANQGWVPVSGDWDGNGTSTVGLYDPHSGFFFFTNTN